MPDDFASVAFVLRELRDQGADFPTAWAAVVPVATEERPSLRVVLDETREGWQRAYDGAPATAGETAGAYMFAVWSGRDEAEDRSELVGVRCG